MPSRREIIAVTLPGAIIGLSSIARAQQLTKVRVGKAISSSFPFSGLELGVKSGIWKAVGLDVEISTFRGDGQLQQALAAGSIDFGLGSGPGMGYAAKGVPAHAVAAVANKPANMALVVGKASGVTNIAGLKGKRIGVSTAGSLTDWLARNIAVSNKWKPSDIEILPMGDMRARLAAMRSGELTAAVTSVQEAYEIQDNGQGTVLATFADVVPHFHTHVVFARDALIKGNPDLVRRFLKGWFTVAAYMRDHRAEAVKAAADTMKLDPKVIDQTYPIEISGMNFDGSFDPAALDVIRASLKDLGILDTAPPVSAMLVRGFAPVKVN
jgi:ABC-type nitrate/sulfonate/bicarbonate transport system substrate-binding protein